MAHTALCYGAYCTFLQASKPGRGRELTKDRPYICMYVWLCKFCQLLTPLTCLTSANIKFEWTNVEQMAFDKIKQIVRHEMLLSYPDPHQPLKFTLTLAIPNWLGAVISQKKSQLPSTQGNFNWLKGDIQPLNMSCYLSLKLSKSSKTSF